MQTSRVGQKFRPKNVHQSVDQNVQTDHFTGEISNAEKKVSLWDENDPGAGLLLGAGVDVDVGHRRLWFDLGL